MFTSGWAPRSAYSSGLFVSESPCDDILFKTSQVATLTQHLKVQYFSDFSANILLLSWKKTSMESENYTSQFPDDSGCVQDGKSRFFPVLEFREQYL